MDSYKIDTTKLIRDPFKTPMPRINPITDLKYFTSGFIFLQDLIEQAIIQNQTGRQQLPGISMQQFPSPCYVYDTFFMAIANLFPLFMILSFVYAASMTVKSVVHEKERRLKEKNQANTKKFMDERKNMALKQNKKREKQKKLHETQLQEIINYIKSVSSSYESLSQFFG